MVKTYKAKLTFGGSGVVQFDNTTHCLPEDYDGEAEAVATVIPTVWFVPGCGDPGCDCKDEAVAFKANKKLAATLRSVADLIEANPISTQHNHHITFHQ